MYILWIVITLFIGFVIGMLVMMHTLKGDDQEPEK